MNSVSKLVERLCPEGVKVVKLGEIGTFTRGNGLQKSDFVEEGFPCIHYGQLHTAFNLETDKVISYCSEEFAKKLKKAKHGDVLIATTSEDVEACCKAVAWMGKGEVAYSGDSFCYSHNQDPKYIAHYFYTEQFAKQKRMVATGAKVVRVSGDALAQIEIPLPPKEIQEEIVSILDGFTKVIDKIDELIKLRQQQFEYYREKLLSFEEGEDSVKWKKMGEIFTFKNGLNKGKEFFGKGCPIIMYTNVYKSSSVRKNDIKNHVDITQNELARIDALRGDVFFTRTSETQEDVGQAAVLLDNIDNCTFAGFLIRARPIGQDLLPKYSKYCFSTTSIHKCIVEKSSFTTRASLTGGGLSQVRIPVPPLAKQKEIVDILDKFEEVTEKLKKKRDLRQKQYEYYREALLTF